MECINSYAILCTQSNDFVLGFPVLSSIYGVSHKEYHMYPYLLAPMSLASLNPIGFILMEIGKSRDSSIAISRVKIAMKTVQGIIKNSIIMMTITPVILVTVKSLVLPIISREIVSQLDAGKDANETLDYAFLYGTIPTAPSVFVYASNYGVLPDMIASTITAPTFIAAPLMFVSAKLLTLMNINQGDYIKELDVFLKDISVYA